MAEFQRTLSNPAGVSSPIGPFSQAIRVKGGDLLFISGQVGIDVDVNLVGEGDVGAQTRQIFHNIGTILGSFGASFSNIVQFTTYLVGKDAVQPYMDVRMDLYTASFPDGDYPTNTLVIIDALVRDEFLVEISAIAALP